MTAEQTFKFYRAYKLFYQGNFDIKKYGGNIRTQPLIQQPDRRFYYRISQKLNDAQVHALFTSGFFFNPRAYVADLATPDAFSAAVTFASRAENGRPLLEADLYELAKRLKKTHLDTWLYGEYIDQQRAGIPPCLQEIIAGELPIDVACILLLIPQKELCYHWVQSHTPTNPALSFGSLGATAWIDRLKRADQLLYSQRPGWRTLTHELAKEFWADLKVKSLAPEHWIQEAALF